MLYVVRGLYRLAQRYKERKRSKQRTEVRPENLFGVCAVPLVCLFLLNFARVSKCLFWYAVNRQISLCVATPLVGHIKYVNATANGHLELTLLKGRQRFDAVSTSNLEVYKFRDW